MAYIGNTVQNQGFAPAVDYFNGDGTTVTFTLSRPVASVAQLTAVIDNVIQNPSSAFTVSGNAITFTSAPLSGTNNIWVEYTSLITTYAAISQDPSVIGDITASGGYLAVGDFGNTYIDGTIVDYVTGNARITTGPADGLTIYNGGTSARTALAAWDTSGNLTNTGGAVIQGLTVGKGANAVAENTAVGNGALSSGSLSGDYNTAVGRVAMQQNTTGEQNVAFGRQALGLNTTGSLNTAIGHTALYSNTTASNNTAVGYQAGFSNQTGALNTFVGFQAGYLSNISGNGFNAVFGSRAGQSMTTAQQNTFIGDAAGLSTTGSFNTLVGQGAGNLITTGAKNTVIGVYNGNQGGLDIRTASNYIVLADGDGNPRLGIDGSGFVFVGTTKAALGGSTFSVQNVGGTAGYFEQTGAGGYNVVLRTVSNGGTWYFQQFATYPTNSENGTITSNGSNVSYNTSSDYRLKENIAPLSGGLNRVLQLKPVTYRWKETGLDGEGFIAHELQEVIPEAVVGIKDQVNEDGSIKPQGIDASFVVATLVAAIQELKAQVDAQAAEIAELKAGK